MNKDELLKAIFFVLFLMAILGIGFFFAYSIILSDTAKGKCERYCNETNALTYDLIPTGNLDTKDICICYYSESLNVHQLP